MIELFYRVQYMFPQDGYEEELACESQDKREQQDPAGRPPDLAVHFRKRVFDDYHAPAFIHCIVAPVAPGLVLERLEEHEIIADPLREGFLQKGHIHGRPYRRPESGFA